jgi:hypothetical protein
MIKFRLVLFALCAALPAHAHPGHGKDRGHSHPLMLPFVERVDAQPLLLQCGRLAEALQSIGAPLPAATLEGLEKLANLEDDPAITRQIQDLLDPLCVAALEIGADGKLEASPALNGLELEENGWRTVLVKVINKAGVSSRLRIDSPAARSIPHAPAAEVKDRWMGLSVFEGRPLATELSGLWLEYRVIQLSAIGSGERSAAIEFNVSGLPGRKSGVIRQWRFNRDTDGWGEANQGGIRAAVGGLEFTSTGGDPFMFAPVEARAGRMKLRFQAHSDVGGMGQLLWTSPELPTPDAQRQISFQMLKGASQLYEIEFEPADALAGIRLDPAMGPGKIRIDWIDLEYARGDSADWVPVMMKFKTVPSIPVTFQVKDADGMPCMAAFEIRDALGRVYPAQTKRIAPDFFFQPQIYRESGETIHLAAGAYTVKCSHGPESIPEMKTLVVDDKPATLSYQVKRWIDTDKHGYWSGDTHIHAAGCLHYVKPTEGVNPRDMMRHISGEDLKIGCCLTWGPCFDFQKQFFTGKPDNVSRPPYQLRYDIEVSGFGAHMSGHLCLLNLKQQIPAGGDSVHHWPTLGLNTLRWAKAQGAVTGTAHSGIGLTEFVGRTPGEDGPGGLPNYNLPNFDGIGAMEFIVNVTHTTKNERGEMVPAIDFIATMNTDRTAEWNMWYHVLNCGMGVVASGETDFPCFSGERVGIGRSYVKLPGKPEFNDWVGALRDGGSYVSDGTAHLMDFERLEDGSFAVNAAVRREGAPPQDIELIVNGLPVAKQSVPADGSLKRLVFPAPAITRSSWVAVRHFPSAHSNPVRVLIGGKPVRASKHSAEWCLAAVDQCWKQKAPFYAEAERADAEAAYQHVRETYRRILAECAQ